MFVIKLLINAYRLISTSCPPGWLDKTKLAVQPAGTFSPTPSPEQIPVEFSNGSLYYTRYTCVYIYVCTFLLLSRHGDNGEIPRSIHDNDRRLLRVPRYKWCTKHSRGACGAAAGDPRVNQPDRSMIYKKGRKRGGGGGGGSCDTGMARMGARDLRGNSEILYRVHV